MSSNVRRTSPAFTSFRRHDPFVEFYTGLSATDVDKQTLQRRYSQIVDKLKVYRRREILLSDDPRQDGPISVFDRLYSAVNYGRLPDSEFVSFGGSVGVKSYWMEVGREISLSGSFLEIGDCVTAFQIAADHPNITVAAIVSSDTNIPFCLDNADSGGLDNFNLGFVESGDMQDLVEQLYLDPQVMFGTVFVSNLTQLADSLLPHELEEMVARVLSLAPLALVMNSPQGNMLNYFTSQWSSLKGLLQTSCQRAGLDCTIDAPYSGALWKNNGTVYKVRVTQGARDLPAPICKTLTNTPDCVLLYNSNSSRTVIQAVNGKMYPFSLNYSTVSLDVLLKLNPVRKTKEKLFRLMIALPRFLEVKGLVQRLSISGGSLTLSHPSTAHSTREEAGPSNKTSPTSVQKIIEGDIEDLSVKNAVESLDGGEDKDQWLREDDNRIDSELDKDRAWSDRIDSLWAREGRAQVAVKGQGADLKEAPHVYQNLQQEEEEPGLTRDEQELQQAIGFLYGDSNQAQSGRRTVSRTATPSVFMKAENSFQSLKAVDSFPVKEHEENEENNKLKNQKLVFQFSRPYSKETFKRHEPQEVGKRHEPQQEARNHEPLKESRRHEPQEPARWHDSQEAVIRHDRQEAARTHKPQVAARSLEQQEEARSPEPQEVISQHEPAPNLAQPPEQNLHVARQMKGGEGREINHKEEMLNLGKASVTATPSHNPRPKKHRIMKKKFNQPERAKGNKPGQRRLLMANSSIHKQYLTNLEEHAAQLRSRSAARPAGKSDTNELTQTMMSKIRVEDSRNGTYSGLWKKVIEYSEGRTSTARRFRHAFTHHRSGQQSFDHYWRILRPLFVEETERVNAHFNLLTFAF
ncbi:uncharacterized protein LOC135470257 isoform X1 [Liolophura sinensis]|uniref:uncharacterized protein LOC135470257 isoform X1 n=1 Tax=Liolophura sinensis TaxID=3198878 RepID=UPI0031593AE0